MMIIYDIFRLAALHPIGTNRTRAIDQSDWHRNRSGDQSFEQSIQSVIICNRANWAKNPIGQSGREPNRFNRAENPIGDGILISGDIISLLRSVSLPQALFCSAKNAFLGFSDTV